MKVSFEGIEFDEEATSGFTLRSFDGWDDGATPRPEVDLIPQGDGAFEVARTFKAARVMTLSGLLLDGPASKDLGRQFRAAQASGIPSQMVVDDAGDVLTVEVSVNDTPRLRPVVGGLYDYSLTVIARDPSKYGPESSSSSGLPSLSGGLVFPFVFPVDFASSGDPGRVTLVNPGTQSSWPRFSVRGGLGGGFSLVAVETGQEIRFEFPLSDTDVVTLDARSGRAWINDEANSVTGYLTVADWWSVPAGESRTVQFNALGGSSGSPLLTGVVAPAYL